MKSGRAAKLFHFFSFLLFLFVCFCGWRVAKKFGIVTLDQIFFHLMAPLDGMDKELVLWGIRYACIFMVLLGLYSLVMFHGKLSSKLSSCRYLKYVYRPYSSLWHVGIGICFIVISIIFAEVKYGAVNYLFAGESSFIKDHYAYCKASDVHFVKKKQCRDSYS